MGEAEIASMVNLTTSLDGTAPVQDIPGMLLDKFNIDRAAAPAPGALVRLCAWCFPTPAHIFARRPDWLGILDTALLTHGICDSCLAGVKATLPPSRKETPEPPPNA